MNKKSYFLDINQEPIVYNKSSQLLEEIRNESKPKERNPIKGSYIEFFVNGISQGHAFEDILEGTFPNLLSWVTRKVLRHNIIIHACSGANPNGSYLLLSTEKYFPFEFLIVFSIFPFLDINLHYLPLSKLVDSSYADGIAKQRKLEENNGDDDEMSSD